MFFESRHRERHQRRARHPAAAHGESAVGDTHGVFNVVRQAGDNFSYSLGAFQDDRALWCDGNSTAAAFKQFTFKDCSRALI